MTLDDDPRKDAVLQRIYNASEQMQLLLQEVNGRRDIPEAWKNAAGRLDDNMRKLYVKVKRTKLPHVKAKK